MSRGHTCMFAYTGIVGVGFRGMRKRDKHGNGRGIVRLDWIGCVPGSGRYLPKYQASDGASVSRCILGVLGRTRRPWVSY